MPRPPKPKLPETPAEILDAVIAAECCEGCCQKDHNHTGHKTIPVV